VKPLPTGQIFRVLCALLRLFFWTFGVCRFRTERPFFFYFLARRARVASNEKLFPPEKLSFKK